MTGQGLGVGRCGLPEQVWWRFRSFCRRKRLDRNPHAKAAANEARVPRVGWGRLDGRWCGLLLPRAMVTSGGVPEFRLDSGNDRIGGKSIAVVQRRQGASGKKFVW
jgi:hypothetical protein